MAGDLKDLTTAELLKIATAPGDRPRFGEVVAELVLRYKNVVYAQAFAVCGKQSASVDDVFQETFVRVFSWLKERRQESLHSFPGLLKVFSHRAAIDLLRKEGRKEERNQPSGPDTEPTELPDVELALYVQQLLEELDERSAQVLRLSYLEGRSAKEIATMLGKGVTPGYVRVLRYRALEAIRSQEALDRYAEQIEPL
jgi:RNA polymerase sigma factor (sigma-70 family)